MPKFLVTADNHGNMEEFSGIIKQEFPEHYTLDSNGEYDALATMQKIKAAGHIVANAGDYNDFSLPMRIKPEYVATDPHYTVEGNHQINNSNLHSWATSMNQKVDQSLLGDLTLEYNKYKIKPLGQEGWIKHLSKGFHVDVPDYGKVFVTHLANSQGTAVTNYGTFVPDENTNIDEKFEDALATQIDPDTKLVIGGHFHMLKNGMTKVRDGSYVPNISIPGASSGNPGKNDEFRRRSNHSSAYNGKSESKSSAAYLKFENKEWILDFYEGGNK